MAITILKWYLIINNTIVTINLVNQLLNSDTKIRKRASLLGVLFYAVPMMVYLLVV